MARLTSEQGISHDTREGIRPFQQEDQAMGLDPVVLLFMIAFLVLIGWLLLRSPSTVIG